MCGCNTMYAEHFCALWCAHTLMSCYWRISECLHQVFTNYRNSYSYVCLRNCTTPTYMYMYLCVCICTCMCIHVYIHVYVRTHVCMGLFMCALACMYVWAYFTVNRLHGLRLTLDHSQWVSVWVHHALTKIKALNHKPETISLEILSGCAYLWARSSESICRDGPISRWWLQSMY